jgi:hypothetical protein
LREDNSAKMDINIHHGRGPLVAASIIGVTAVSFAAVVLRFVARGWIVRKITVDDWLIAVAWV